MVDYGFSDQIHTPPLIDSSAQVRAQYIVQLIEDLKVFSPDTLSIATAYSHRTGLYLPLVKILQKLREIAVKQTDSAQLDRMYRIRDDTVEYLQYRLANLVEPDGASTSSPSLLRAEEEAEPHTRQQLQLIGEYLQGGLVTVEIITRNQARALLPIAVRIATWLRSYPLKQFIEVSNRRSDDPQQRLLCTRVSDLLSKLESALSSGNLDQVRAVLLEANTLFR